MTWRIKAACLGQDPSVYDTNDDFKPHREIRCFLCPVRASCLTYALNGRESGTWGGLSRKQREQIQSRISRRRKLRACPLCRNTTLLHDDDGTEEGTGTGSCPSCGFTWWYVETTYGPRAVTTMDGETQPVPVNPVEA